MGTPFNFQNQYIVIIYIFYFHVIVIFSFSVCPKLLFNFDFFFLILEIVFETSIQRRQGQHMDEMTFITDYLFLYIGPFLHFISQK